MESWNAERYREAGLNCDFVQDNISLSRRGILRGLHFQFPESQSKLVYVLQGEVFDVVVDLRRSSPAFGCWHGITLSADNKRQFFIPAGFAHGFVVTGEAALFAYKCTAFYSAQNELTLAWDDPELGIQWPVKNPQLSAKDERGLRLREIPADRLFP